MESYGFNEGLLQRAVVQITIHIKSAKRPFNRIDLSVLIVIEL